MRIFSIGLFIWLLSLSTSLQAKTAGFTFAEPGAKTVRIPVEIQHNVVLLPLRINGSFEMTFILDTGVKTTILTEGMLVNFMGIDSMTPVRLRGLGEGSYIEGLLAQNINMSMPGIIGKGINLVVLPNDLISYSGMFGKPVYGIIGYEIFGQFVVEINYQHEYIELHDPFSYKPPRNKRRNETIPMKIYRFKPYITAALSDDHGNRIEKEWLLDTGASHAVSVFYEDLPLPDPYISAFLGMGLSGNVYGHIGRNPTFHIGKFSFNDVITGYPDSNSIYLIPEQEGWYGNIGSEIISRFNVVFDYFHGRLILRRNPSYNDPFEYNHSGLEVSSNGADYSSYIITYVRPGSAAEEAGIRINDVILSLNGIPTGTMSITDMYNGLRRRGGKNMTCRIRRGEEVFRVKFRVEEEI